MLKFLCWILPGLFLVAGCSEKEKVWIVVELSLPTGEQAKMVFDNPAVSDMSIEDCKNSLEAAIPTLLRGIRSKPETESTKFLGAECVLSADDPLLTE